MKGIEKALRGMIAVLTMMLVSITKRLPVVRRLSSGITTLTLAGIVLLVAAGGVSAYDCDWNVNPGDSIQAAIDNAVAGDTICVHAGTYSEYMIDVDKSLTLIGVDGMDDVIVDGTGGYSYLMKVSADEVTVSGFTLRNLQSCSSGVMMVDGSHCNISYNDIHQGQAFTFKMNSGTDDNILKGNTIYYASCGCDGMFTIRGTNHVVTDNTIGQQGGAINVYCTESLIYNNDFGTGISVPGAGNTWNTTYAGGERTSLADHTWVETTSLTMQVLMCIAVQTRMNLVATASEIHLMARIIYRLCRMSVAALAQPRRSPVEIL